MNFFKRDKSLLVETKLLCTVTRHWWRVGGGLKRSGRCGWTGDVEEYFSLCGITLENEYLFAEHDG